MSGVQTKRGLSGLGLFATQDFKRGDFIIEYTGEYISREEADRRGGKYLFTVNKNLVIDGKERSNTARYINHACRPNSYAELDEEEERIRIYAKRKITSGEEITYHYGREYFNDMIGSDCRCTTCRANT